MNGSGVPGIPVTFTTDKGTLNPTASTTNASGAYLFDNLPPGNYLVKVEEQEVVAPPSSPHAGQYGYMQASTGTTKAVALAAGPDAGRSA